jgi:hypothetical protein
VQRVVDELFLLNLPPNFNTKFKLFFFRANTKISIVEQSQGNLEPSAGPHENKSTNDLSNIQENQVLGWFQSIFNDVKSEVEKSKHIVQSEAEKLKHFFQKGLKKIGIELGPQKLLSECSAEEISNAAKFKRNEQIEKLINPDSLEEWIHINGDQAYQKLLKEVDQIVDHDVRLIMKVDRDVKLTDNQIEKYVELSKSEDRVQKAKRIRINDLELIIPDLDVSELSPLDIYRMYEGS